MNQHDLTGSGISTEQLAQLVGGVLRGRGDGLVTGIADVEEAGPGDAAWASSAKYAAKVAASRAGVVLVRSDFGPTPMPAILCDRIDDAVARLLAAFRPPASRPEPGVHPSAVVHASATLGPGHALGPHVVVEQGAVIGANATLHAGVFIGREAKLGDDCTLWPHVSVRDGCVLGNRVEIHSHSVIGSDGFGYYFAGGRHHKYPHAGSVIIEDDVEIGSCSCVDRAKFGFTIVGAGTKIDNLVQVAHNVRLGKHCIVVGESGIGGSVRTGDYVVFAGRSVALDNLAIGDRATLAACAVATKDIPAGATVSGFPAQDHREELRERAALRKLPELVAEIRELKARVKQLEESAHHRT
jgi:UDP-3-O-[3-hydroxymyristoyl] glucosamine N-acyltransferase